MGVIGIATGFSKRKKEYLYVLEVARKNNGGELVRVPNDEAVASSTPRRNRVRRWVFHHFKGLGCPKKITNLLLETPPLYLRYPAN
ncbi:hypothetical protein FH972_010542 [Carpinus fangiana]|uniref:Uncharacterized protein n=1 Tax=Carpinus fangiana TaxID=176857 RepID=A0A660KQD1_9ROSI|nr:hypothetical protein FH972_010542 [Carpinus fangiana]